MKKLAMIAASFLLASMVSAAEAPPPQKDDKDQYILRLEKKVAELQMEILQQQYLNMRGLWKEKLKALGEPDPDAPPPKAEEKHSSEEKK